MQPSSKVAQSPTKSRKSPKTASARQEAGPSSNVNAAGPSAVDSSMNLSTSRQSNGNTSMNVSNTSVGGSTTQTASPNQTGQSTSSSMMSPLMFSSSAATLSHMQQLRLRQHSKAILLRRLEDGGDLCNYTHRICLQNKLDGFDHCIRHILYDKNNTFRQCSFVHPQSHKRCPNAARKTERKEAICPWHFKKFFLKRKQAQAALEEKSSKGTFTQNAFRELEHYCPSNAHDKKRLNAAWTKQEDHSVTASDFLRQKITEKTASNEDKESDDELNNPLVDSCFRSDLIDSDSESIDSDNEEVLKNAGVYTAEEVSMILRNKMLRLQSLYMNEFKYLRHLLKEKYKKYLFSLKNEREIYRIDSQPFTPNKCNSEDKQRLKAMLNYHRHHGVEALLKIQVQEKRKQATGQQDSSNETKAIQSKCIYSKEGELCARDPLPLSTYCKNHILFDNQQILFRPCATGDPPCLSPVISFQKENTCLLHREQKTNASLNKLIEEEQKMNESVVATESDVLQAMNEIAAGNFDAVESSQLFALDSFPDLDPNLNRSAPVK